MNRMILGMVAGGIALGAPGPALSQTAASPPSLTAEQALQLVTEAGFTLRDGRPVNRCGNPVNPRVAFIDLNGDRQAEAHIADVDPACYGKPGAYFAILAQGPDKSWKRLIAEDGIVGFEQARTQGWNDLSLEARDSACPGVRHFNGVDYGAPGACAMLAETPATVPPAAAAPASPAELSGSRPEQIAQLLRNLVGATQSRTWDSVIAAFPGAQWQARTNHAANWTGSTSTQRGSIMLGGAEYGVSIGGTAARINEIMFDSPGDDLVGWAPIEAALRALGMEARNIGCHSPTGFGWVRLAASGKSAVLHKSINYGTGVPSTDIYSFVLDDPFDGRSEAEIAADRSLC